MSPAGRSWRILRARAEINSHFGASAEGPDARRRDAGDAAVHRRGAPTTQTAPRRRAPSGCSKVQMLFCDGPLGFSQKISWRFGASAGQAEVRKMALLSESDIL